MANHRDARQARRAPIFITSLLPLLFLFASSPAGAGEKEKAMLGEERLRLKAAMDFRRSPFTGYTRDHWLEITERLIAGVMPYVDATTGMPNLVGVPGESGHFQRLNYDRREYSKITAKKEALERIMMLSVVYTAATGKDAVPGYRGSISAPFLRGMVRMTDPHDPAFYARPGKYDYIGSSFALAALLSPRFFWDPLRAEEKKNLLAYLRDIAYAESYDNNHYFFHMMPVPLLERNGVDANREHLTAMFERLLGWYRGDGWFLDGGAKGFDYYNLWGFQLFSHALCKLDAPWRARFSKRVDETTARFLETYPYLYGRDGGPIPWGRSLTYRFAGLAAIGWAALDGADTLPPGQSRRIASGCLRYFWEHGAMSENGLLEIGFHGPNTVVAEPYTDHGGSYWAAQGLIALLLPRDDPFWTTVEAPMPADGAGGRLALEGPQMAIRVNPLDGEARLYPVGQPFTHWGEWQRGIKYCQHAYSSALGWAAGGEGGADLGQGRTGTSYDGVTWHYRERPRALSVEPDHLISVYDMETKPVDYLSPAWNDIGEVTTHTLVSSSGGEVHVFWHNSPRPVYLYVGGYGISVPFGQELRRDAGDRALVIHDGDNHSALAVLDAPEGRLDAELLEPRPGWTHSHLFGGRGAFPYWRSASPVPPNVPVVVYVDGARGRQPALPKASVTTDKGVMRVALGGESWRVRVPY